MLGLDIIAEQDGAAAAVEYLVQDARGFTCVLANPIGLAIAGQLLDMDAYGNGLNFTAATAGTEWTAPDGRNDVETGNSYHNRRYMNRFSGRAISGDGRVPGAGDLLNTNLFLYGSANPVFYSDPSGNSSLLSTILTAGIKGGLLSLAFGVPFRAIQAGRDLYAGASLRGVATDFLTGSLTDFALGAVLGGGAAGIIRQFASNAFKIRSIGQSIANFTSARVPWSAWRMAASARGLAIERAILNRAAGFLGQQLRNFPVIDDYIVSGGRGIATSIKSLDLTAPTYQAGSAIVSRLNSYARSLQNFTGAAKPGFQVGIGTANAIDDKVLVLAFEEGAATSAQAATMVDWVRGATTNFPNIKVAVQFVP